MTGRKTADVFSQAHRRQAIHSASQQSNRLDDLPVGNLVHHGDQVADPVTVHRETELHFRRDSGAFGHGRLPHVVALQGVPPAGHAHP
jgi:hypothetical protein